MGAAAAAVVVPLAAGCGGGAAGGLAGSGQEGGQVEVGSSAGSGRPVTGVDWRVDSVTAGGTTLRAPAGARLRIDADGRASGNLGCNLFSAQVTLHGDRITFGGLRTTRMACAPDRMTFERALARVLGRQTLTARTDDGKLTLTTGHGERVNLVRITPH
ncbi:META domain-containing protein [Streptomyces sp. NPDC046805]|uniref:META domain-containing protein n=1 Tax=Streptomyces sp. NPDC046805 TaxID=3155134 RepID=UPI0033FA417A